MEKIFLDFLSVAFRPVVPSLESFIGLLTGAEEQKEERAVNFYSLQINTSNTPTPSPTVRERAFVALMCDLKNVVHAKPPTLIDISCSKKGHQMFNVTLFIK